MKIVLPVLLSALAAAGAGIRTLGAEFTKVSSDAGGRDSAAGRIFFRSPSDIFITIRHPVEQSLYLGEKSMVVQYPRKKLALTYTSKTPFSLPMFQALMGVMEGEGAVARSGFSLVATEKRGDTAVSEWVPRKGGRKESPIVSMKVHRHQGSIVRFAAYDRGGALKKRVSYSDFQATAAGRLPCRIRSEEFDGKAVTVEEFGLQGLQVNPAAPAEVEQWRIPPDFAIKEFKW